MGPGTHPASSIDICVWSASVGRRPPSTSKRVSEGVFYVKACCPSEGPLVPSAENILFIAPCSSSSGNVWKSVGAALGSAGILTLTFLWRTNLPEKGIVLRTQDSSKKVTFYIDDNLHPLCLVSVKDGDIDGFKKGW